MKKHAATTPTPRSKSITAAAPRVAKPRQPKRTATAPAADAPSEADISRRAYEIFLARNGEPGDSVSDWLQAESDLVRAS